MQISQGECRVVLKQTRRRSRRDAFAVGAATRGDAFWLGQRLLLAAKASRRPGCRKLREMGTPVKLATTKEKAE